MTPQDIFGFFLVMAWGAATIWVIIFDGHWAVKGLLIAFAVVSWMPPTLYERRS